MLDAKWSLLLAMGLLSAVVAGCRRRPEAPTEVTVERLLPMTPVKNQGQRELCWAYAMLATIETEHLMRGDSVNLSPVYVGRMLPDYRQSLNGKSVNGKSVNGKSVNGKSVNSKSVNERAMCQTLLNIIGRYGIVPYDVMPDDATSDLPTPKWVFMLGAKYTPLEFAHSVCAPDEYVSLTSEADSPYYKKIDVPNPDNWEHNRMLNVPLDTLRFRTERALRRGHPVCWESKAHAMCIVGLARDKRQRPRYILKNSWGTADPDRGMVYMSPRRLWRDVSAVYMTRDAWEGIEIRRP
jgi:bleomycin hydrolase